MSRFSIAFVEDQDDDGERAGNILIGDFEEGFLAPTEFWDAAAYRRQWLEGARRFADGAERSCFVIQAGEPDIDDFVEWWTVHRRGATAVFHNQHIQFAQMGAAFSYARLYENIADIASLSSLAISEWSVEADAIARFVRDHAG